MSSVYRIGKIVTMAVAAVCVIGIAAVIAVGLITGGQKKGTDGLDVDLKMDEFWNEGEFDTTKCDFTVLNYSAQPLEGWRLILDCSGSDIQVKEPYNCTLSSEGTFLIVESTPEVAHIDGAVGKEAVVGAQFGFKLSVPAGEKFTFGSMRIQPLAQQDSVQ